MTDSIVLCIDSLILQEDHLVLEFIETAIHPVHKVPAYSFLMVHAESRTEMGKINLRLGTGRHIERYGGHIGYSVDVEHRGNRYASRSLSLLKPLARRLGLESLWVTCDPENVASRRTCELAGARFVEIVDVPETCIIRRAGHLRRCRYLLPL